MSKSISILPTFCVLIVLLFCSAIRAQTSVDTKVDEEPEFDLSLGFYQLGFGSVEFNTRIKPNKTFTGTAADKDGNAYKFGGMLLPAKDGRHKLVVTVVGPGEGRISTWVADLELDKIWSIGIAASLLLDSVSARLSIPKVPEKNL